METEALSNIAASASDLPAVAAHIDVSIWGLIMKADAIVKAVMLSLVVASVVSWGIIFDRLITIRNLTGKLTQFESAFWSGQPLDDLYHRLENRADHPGAKIFVSALREWRRCTEENFPASFIRERVESVIGLILNRETQGLEKRTSFLATVGSVAPFVGLFGTVWGIMNSFTAIANSNNTSLTVVAPGIAEALFATALGLVAAIPAVMAYNKINSNIGKLSGRLEAFSEELSGVLAKQTQKRMLTGKEAA